MTDAAVAVAGAWTTDPSLLPAELHGAFRAVMGWGGMAVWDDSVDIVDLTREYARQTVQECCGQCFPCRIGMHEVGDILEEICEGRGSEERLQRAYELAQHVAEASRCDLGRSGGYAVLESLEQNREAEMFRPVPVDALREFLMAGPNHGKKGRAAFHAVPLEYPYAA